MKDNDNKPAWPLIISILLIIGIPFSAMAYFSIKNRKKEIEQVPNYAPPPLPSEKLEDSLTSTIISPSEIDYTDSQEDLQNES